MNAANLLRHAANVIVGATLVKAIASDLGAEISRDLSGLRSQTDAAVHRSPYGAAGTAAAVGMLAGILLSRHHPPRH